MLALLAAITAAVVVTAWLAWMLHVEQRMLADLIAGQSDSTSDVPRTLRELRWQYGLAIVVLVILVATLGKFAGTLAAAHCDNSADSVR